MALSPSPSPPATNVPQPPMEMHEGTPLDRRVFDSWDEFHAYMETYARRSFQLFRKRTSTSVKLRNRRVAERFSSKMPVDSVRTESARLIPETYRNYSLTLVCTHSGAFVSRGTGQRSRQDVRATHCNVQVNACLKLADPIANRYQINVTRALLTHNHRVDKETFLRYSNTRLNLSDELLSCVELMRKTGVKPKDIRAYIMAHSNCAPTLKDVQNILHRLRNQEEAAVAAAAVKDADHQQTEPVAASNTKRNEPAAPKLTSEEQVLHDYRLTLSASADEALNLVDPTMQFKVARAMGKAVATLLAEMSATEFAGAFRVLEVATNIVRERREENQVQTKPTSDEGETTTGYEILARSQTSRATGSSDGKALSLKIESRQLQHMASARPQLTPAAAVAGAATKQPRTSKKRKASSDAPAVFRASAAARDASGVSARCSLCGFGASTLDHLLTHVRESHGRDHEQVAPQMALPFEVAQMLVQRALDRAALGGATSAWLEAMQQQYSAAAEMTAALERRDAHGVAVAIRKLHGLAQAGDENSMLTTLQQAAQILLQSPPQATDATPVPAVTIKQEIQAHNPAQAAENATTSQQNGKDSGIHEAEAAQALTGLRATASCATETTTTTAPAISTSSARPPAVPKPSPSALQASFPSFALGSPLTITAPQPGNPHFHPPELFTPGSARSPTTPSSLPSLFARRLLAPLASPSSVAEGDRLTQGVAGIGYQNPMIVTDQRNPMGSTIRPDTSPASLTPVFYSSFPTLSAVNNATNAGATPTNRPTSTSPLKRKSITSKQLSVRCDAEVAAARAAASTAAAAADTSGLVPLGPISVPGTPSTPATRKATPRRWTKEEDDALRAAVENHREKNWKAIAAQVPGRNHTQCLQRWTKVLAPGLVKGHWSPHEDELLRRLVATEQKNWGDVASKIPGRTSKQCRERWHNHLDPQIVRGAYTPEEDRLILEAQARLGNRWSVIAAMLPGRTEDAVKIRWKSHCRVWRARKYLRKNPNSDVDMLSEPAQTPRTPLVPPTGDFKWPVPLTSGPADEQESNTSKTSAEATAPAVGGE
ncbi:hypothetical protein PC122_g2602 [Phytophthora cactorum]|nr:hypothetical protein PC122_g2602 [Phytophthora cactorum]